MRLPMLLLYLRGGLLLCACAVLTAAAAAAPEQAFARGTSSCGAAGRRNVPVMMRAAAVAASAPAADDITEIDAMAGSAVSASEMARAARLRCNTQEHLSLPPSWPPAAEAAARDSSSSRAARGEYTMWADLRGDGAHTWVVRESTCGEDTCSPAAMFPPRAPELVSAFAPRELNRGRALFAAEMSAQARGLGYGLTSATTTLLFAGDFRGVGREHVCAVVRRTAPANGGNSSSGSGALECFEVTGPPHAHVADLTASAGTTNQPARQLRLVWSQPIDEMPALSEFADGPWLGGGTTKGELAALLAPDTHVIVADLVDDARDELLLYNSRVGQFAVMLWDPRTEGFEHAKHVDIAELQGCVRCEVRVGFFKLGTQCTRDAGTAGWSAAGGDEAMPKHDLLTWQPDSRSLRVYRRQSSVGGYVTLGHVLTATVPPPATAADGPEELSVARVLVADYDQVVLHEVGSGHVRVWAVDCAFTPQLAPPLEGRVPPNTQLRWVRLSRALPPLSRAATPDREPWPFGSDTNSLARARALTVPPSSPFDASRLYGGAVPNGYSWGRNLNILPSLNILPNMVYNMDAARAGGGGGGVARARDDLLLWDARVQQFTAWRATVAGSFELLFSTRALALDQDPDDDGLLTRFELGGLDANLDGVSDEPLHDYGAWPFVRDVFVEIDFMRAADRSLEPMPAARALAVSEMARGGVRLHPMVDGEVPFLEYIGTPDRRAVFDWETYVDPIRDLYFTPSRWGLFHYCVFGQRHNGRDSRVSGRSRGIPGREFLITLGAWTSGGSVQEQAGTFLHELGHNLALRHGGVDNVSGKPNHLSIMNHIFQVIGVWKDGGVQFIYSEVKCADLDEHSLDENAGVACQPPGNRQTLVNAHPFHVNVPIDFNRDHVLNTDVTWDLNEDGKITVLKGGDNEYSRLVLTALGPLGRPDNITRARAQRESALQALGAAVRDDLARAETGIGSAPSLSPSLADAYAYRVLAARATAAAMTPAMMAAAAQSRARAVASAEAARFAARAVSFRASVHLAEEADEQANELDFETAAHLRSLIRYV